MTCRRLGEVKAARTWYDRAGHPHRLLSFRQPTALAMPRSQVIIPAPSASNRPLRDGRQDFLQLLEAGVLDQVVIEPCFLRTPMV
jgi:hypothetical protein